MALNLQYRCRNGCLETSLRTGIVLLYPIHIRELLGPRRDDSSRFPVNVTRDDVGYGNGMALFQGRHEPCPDRFLIRDRIAPVREEALIRCPPVIHFHYNSAGKVYV